MKYHLQLLKKYISLEVSPEDIARDLILKTCEIEEIHTRNLPKTIVIGKITSIQMRISLMFAKLIVEVMDNFRSFVEERM